MKVFLSIIEIVCCILEVVLMIQLYIYTKQHENEPMELHKSYIFPRFIVVSIIAIGVPLIKLIELLCEFGGGL